MTRPVLEPRLLDPESSAETAAHYRVFNIYLQICIAVCQSSLSGQAPTDLGNIIMELLRAVVVLLGVSMFFSIITSVLTASEELRVNFPSTKYLGASEKRAADSPESMREEKRNETEGPDARINLEDIESGRVDIAGGTASEDNSSQPTISTSQEEKVVDEKEPTQNVEGNQESGSAGN